MGQQELVGSLNHFKNEALELRQENLALQQERAFIQQKLRESEQLQKNLEVQSQLSQSFQGESEGEQRPTF